MRAFQEETELGESRGEAATWYQGLMVCLGECGPSGAMEMLCFVLTGRVVTQVYTFVTTHDLYTGIYTTMKCKKNARVNNSLRKYLQYNR